MNDSNYVCGCFFAVLGLALLCVPFAIWKWIDIAMWIFENVKIGGQ